jgi:MFS family permease
VTGYRHRGLLRANRSFASLWAARVISFAGEQLSLVALILLVHDRYQTGPTVAVLLIATAAPRLLGPLAGAIADRVEQRRLMQGCELGRATVITVIAFTLPPLPVLLALVVLASTLSALFMPAGRSAVPVLVGREQLQPANALLATGSNLGLATGPFIGGALVALVGTTPTLLVDAATSLVAVALLGFLPDLRAAALRRDDAPGIGFEVVDGLRHVVRHRLTRAILMGLTLGVSFAGMGSVAGVFLIRGTLGAGPVAFGLFEAAWGVGMIAGSLALIRWATGRDPTLLFAVGWLLTGAGVAAAGVAPTAAVAILVYAVGGIGNGLDNVATDTILQRVVPRPFLGRAFGVVYTGAFLGSLVAFAVAGWLIEFTDPRTIFLVAGATTLAIGTWLLLALPRIATGET